jgi:hypothetical protein
VLASFRDGNEVRSRLGIRKGGQPAAHLVDDVLDITERMPSDSSGRFDT